MNAITLRTVAVMAGALMGCDLGTGPDHELATARARWAEAGYRHYVLVQYTACFCLPETARGKRAEVVDGAIAGAWFLDTGDAVPPESYHAIKTVADLFDLIEEALADADRLEVTYDAATGYPMSIAIDWIAEAVDDEVGWTSTASPVTPAP